MALIKALGVLGFTLTLATLAGCAADAEGTEDDVDTTASALAPAWLTAMGCTAQVSPPAVDREGPLAGGVSANAEIACDHAKGRHKLEVVLMQFVEGHGKFNPVGGQSLTDVFEPKDRAAHPYQVGLPTCEDGTYATSLTVTANGKTATFTKQKKITCPKSGR